MNNGPALRVANVLFDDRYGGPQKRVIEVARGLQEHGTSTTMYLPVGEGNAEAVAREAGVPVRRIAFERTPRPRDLKRMFRWAVRLPNDVYRFLSAFRDEKPDVVHVNGAFFIAPALAAKVLRIPLVWHLNDTILPRKFVAPFFGKLTRLMANRVVVAAEAVARHYSVPPGSYTTIYAPVDVKKFDGVVAGAGANGTARVGLIANWNPLKGLEYYFRAADLVRGRLDGRLEVVIAGARLDTHTDYARRVEDLIRQLDLTASVRDLGFVSSVGTMLEGLDVLVLSSTTEASPVVVLEGMAAGVPVVATDVGGVRELLLGDPKSPAGTVVRARNPEAIAAAIVELLEDPDMARRMGESGRLLARERFSLEACVLRHRKAYSGLGTGRR